MLAMVISIRNLHVCLEFNERNFMFTVFNSKKKKKNNKERKKLTYIVCLHGDFGDK